MYSVLETMAEERIGSGEKEAELCFSFASFLRCRKAYTFRTYTDGIFRALHILGVTKDSVVAVSALAPYVYYAILKKIGCRVVFADVEEENGLPGSEEILRSGAEFFILYDSAASIAAFYNRDTTFYQKTEYSGVKILEDVTESVGSYIDKSDLYAGSFGDVVLCAMEDNSVVSSAGGCVLGVKDVAGLSESDEEDGGFLSSYTRLTDLNASLALIQLQNIELDSEKRRSILSAYISNFKSSGSRRFGISSTEYTSNGSRFPVFMGSKPDDFILFAKKKGVPLVKTFENSIIAHLDAKYYQELPKSASYYSRTVSFPIYPFLRAQDIDIISKTIGALP